MGLSPPRHDLPSDPGANPWDCFPEGRTQCFSGNVARGLWGRSRCDWGGGAPGRVGMGVCVPASVGGPQSLPLLPLKLLN